MIILFLSLSSYVYIDRKYLAMYFLNKNALVIWSVVCHYTDTFNDYSKQESLGISCRKSKMHLSKIF